jgi:DNA processing protein
MSERTPIVEKIAVLHPLFAQVERPPARVWIEGSEKARRLLDRLPEDGLAIVGTRSPDPRATFYLRSVVSRLRGSRLIVVSGMARGIDSFAHEAALAAGLPTIAILGCGIDRTYPPENGRLRRRILEADGLVLSEFDRDLQARPGCFIQRNRLIAGLSKATWIVQTGFRSGALNTASWARKMDRTVYATPCFPGDPSFLGNHNLLAGEAIPVWSASSFAATWIGRFSDIEKPPAGSAADARLGFHLEVERGLREGRELLEILESRSFRTGESVASLLRRIEEGMSDAGCRPGPPAL